MGFLDDVFDECREELQITPRAKTPKPRKKRSKPRAAAPRRDVRARPSGEGDSLSSTVGSGHRRASGARVLPVDASLEEASPAAERNASGENLKGP